MIMDYNEIANDLYNDIINKLEKNSQKNIINKIVQDFNNAFNSENKNDPVTEAVKRVQNNIDNINTKKILEKNDLEENKKWIDQVFKDYETIVKAINNININQIENENKTLKTTMDYFRSLQTSIDSYLKNKNELDKKLIDIISNDILRKMQGMLGNIRGQIPGELAALAILEKILPKNATIKSTGSLSGPKNIETGHIYSVEARDLIISIKDYEVESSSSGNYVIRNNNTMDIGNIDLGVSVKNYTFKGTKKKSANIKLRSSSYNASVFPYLYGKLGENAMKPFAYAVHAKRHPLDITVKSEKASGVSIDRLAKSIAIYDLYSQGNFDNLGVQLSIINNKMHAAFYTLPQNLEDIKITSKFTSKTFGGKNFETNPKFDLNENYNAYLNQFPGTSYSITYRYSYID